MSFAAWAVEAAPSPVLPSVPDTFNWGRLLFGLALLGLFVVLVASVVMTWLARGKSVPRG
jgi:hypothetical protein